MSLETLASSDSYDSLLDPNNHDLDPPADPDLVNRMVETAAVRRPNLALALSAIEKDPSGICRADEEQSRQILQAFEAFEGFSGQPTTGDEIQIGIKKAKELSDKGQAAEFLRRLPFVDDSALRDLVGNTRPKRFVLKGAALSIRPDKVVGAASFNDWRGRGEKGSGEIADRRTGFKVHSIDKIIDYATQDSELPPLDDVRIFLTDGGIFAYSVNSHRAAAAKLRGENIRVNSFEFCDFRGAPLTELQHQALLKMQAATEQAV